MRKLRSSVLQATELLHDAGTQTASLSTRRTDDDSHEYRNGAARLFVYNSQLLIYFINFPKIFNFDQILQPS